MVASPPLRVVFLGTPAFALPTLDRLLASRHHVVAIITQPDRPSGRGQRTSGSPVKARALEVGLPVLQPARLKEPGFLAALGTFNADIGVVAAYGRLLPEAAFTAPRHGMINVHASLLPRYRGAAPIHRAVIAGERETGVTIMRIVKALDAGPMLAAVRCPVGPDDTSVDVQRQLAELGGSLLVETLDRFGVDDIPETPQDDSQATYAPPLTKEDGVVVWSRAAADIHNQIRGLHPWPHAFSFLDGQRLILHRSAAVDEPVNEVPGTVLAAEGNDFRVATADGAIRLLEVQSEGRRPMDARVFLTGHRIARGSRFASQ
jgi:methionyl-tRNA formyltransferase